MIYPIVYDYNSGMAREIRLAMNIRYVSIVDAYGNWTTYNTDRMFGGVV